MNNLTDEMIRKILEQNDTIGLVLAIVVVIFLFLLGLGLFLYGNNKRKEKKKSIHVSMLIGGVIIIFSIIALIASISSIFKEDNWYLTTSIIIDKNREIDYNSEGRNRIYHYITLENGKEVKVTEDIYNELETNDEVYVLIDNNDAIYVWDTDSYNYTGQNIKS